VLRQELRHDGVGFFRFWELRIVPKRMWQRLEYDQFRIDTCMKVGAVKDRGSAEQQIPSAGDE
jgi:hypothetical protein